jgi:hypothetical protein
MRPESLEMEPLREKLLRRSLDSTFSDADNSDEDDILVHGNSETLDAMIHLIIHHLTLPSSNEIEQYLPPSLIDEYIQVEDEEAPTSITGSRSHSTITTIQLL